MANPIETLVDVLAADDGVSALTALVFGGELPPDDPPEMPQAAIVVVPSGGSSALGGGWLPFGDGRVDVVCYGATPFEAYNVWEAVWSCLTNMRKTGRTHWARQAGGPITYRDPGTDWPIARGSFQVLANQP